MDQKKVLKITSIGIGVVIAVLLMVMGFKVFSGVFTRAADFEPRDVVVSNSSQNSAKISWSTGEDTQGVIEYGTTPTTLNFFAPEPTKTKNHTQDLTLLSPNTTYYFQIRIGDKKYDNGGVPWTFTTKTTEKTRVSEPTPIPTSGTQQSPTPTSVVQRLQIPVTPTLKCEETDCQKICKKLSKGCTTQDLQKQKCIGKINLSDCSLK